MSKVVALGELLVDFASISTNPDGYPIFSANPGGAPANLLSALSRYGIETSFIGKVGADRFGQLLIDTLKQAGIDTSGVVEDDAVFTTLAFVTFDDTGNRYFSFARKPGADTQLCWDEVDTEIIDGCDVFHFGTLSLTSEPSKTATRRAIEYARGKGKLISLDPNLRLSLWPSPDMARESMLWALNQADIVKISDEEVSFLLNCSVDEGVERLFRDFNISLAMITSGADGCLLKNRNAVYTTSSPNVKTVDTTGAGDIFGGSALSRLLRLGKTPSELEPADLKYIADFAVTAASLSTERLGGIPSIPPETDVIRALASFK